MQTLQSNILFFLIFSMFLFTGCGFLSSSAVYEPTPTNFTLEDNPNSYFSIKEDLPANEYGKRQVDILFVVDTSYSMVNHLQKVDQTFNNFIKAFKNFSWKLAFTNAEHHDDKHLYYTHDFLNEKKINLELKGKVLKPNVLTSSMKHNEEIFIHTLKRYEQGDFNIPSNEYINPCELPPYCQKNEKAPIQSLIETVNINQNFIRKGADFVVVFFTNGDDSNINASITTGFLNKFKTSYPQNRIKMYSISIPPGDQTCLTQDRNQQYNRQEELAYSTKIHTLVKATGGRAISICTDDYTPLAQEIVKSVEPLTLSRN